MSSASFSLPEAERGLKDLQSQEGRGVRAEQGVQDFLHATSHS